MLWMVQHLLIVTIVAVILAVGLVALIFVGLMRLYPHEPSRPQFGSAMVSLVVAVVFSVVLSNLYAVKRDSDNRLRALRDQHYGQLKPVLRLEASKLAEIASTMKKQAHMTGVNTYENIDVDVSGMLWPDVMSPDLERHFPEYDRSKHQLLLDIGAQDGQFRLAMGVARSEIPPVQGINAYWKDIAAMAFMEQCLARGPGIRLNVSQGGFSFEYWGASVGASGGSNPPRPDAGQIAAARAFEFLKSAPLLRPTCAQLKQRAQDVTDRANALSRNAQLLSEGTILPGSCEFLRTESLSD